MKKLTLLFIKIFFLNGLLYALLYGTYITFLELSDYTSVRMLNILLVNIAIRIIFIAVAFILTIKILSKNNNELIHNNIKKLILLIISFQLILELSFAFFYFNSIRTPDYVYTAIVGLLNYLFLNIIYSVFILKKYKKVFFSIITFIVVAYGINFLIYRIAFNQNYMNASVQENFYLYPTENIKNIIDYDINQNGNSAQKLVELVNNLLNREEIKDETEKNARSYIQPTEKDINILSQITKKDYLSLSEEYIPDDVILYRDGLFIRLNNIRAFSRGVVKLADKQILQNQYSLAEKNLEQLLLLGDQLIHNKDDNILIKLVGISIAKLGGEKLIELNKNKIQLEKYLSELDEIKENISKISELGINAAESYYSTIDASLYFKYLNEYNSIISSDPIIKYVFYDVDTHPLLYSIRVGANVYESILGMANSILLKINVGKNYTFYKKVIELYRENNSEELNFYLNNDGNTISRKYSAEFGKVFNIQTKIILR